MVRSRHPEVDDPLRIPTDEESLVLSGRGRPHGHFPFLNKVVKPTHATSYTRLKHTLTTDNPQPCPRHARPPAYDPEFAAAFEACSEAYKQAATQWNRKNTAYMAHRRNGMLREPGLAGWARGHTSSWRCLDFSWAYSQCPSVDFSWAYSRCLSVDFS
ncbi:hypothetical protein QYE76_025904 [Lolium multiflorum]|uniref:Uncharacterized protein n=1 Tax=Lolium multiflorum TaxID=4521 RepID=A0AAD8VUN3_LOLMU|nr:hypothetical protein QYE76_025904 [Lolium multiflorum]